MLKLYGGNRVMRTAFYLHYFSKAKLLMLYFLPGLQTTGVAR